MPDRRVARGLIALLALCVVGCAGSPAGVPTSVTASPPEPTATDPGPLPAPEALTGVLYRLADPAVPGAEKLGLVAEASPPEAATLDRFAAALRDGGFAPATFTATDIRWAAQPSTVVATIRVDGTGPDETGPDDPGRPDGTGGFSFPMEFRSTPDGWQLTRDTAEMLLVFGETP